MHAYWSVLEVIVSTIAVIVDSADIPSYSKNYTGYV